MNVERIRKTLIDVFFSLIAYALPTLVLTLIIQPILAKLLGGDINGLFLTKISIIRFCVSFLIASLANTKLLESPRYSGNKIEGDFNILLVAAAAFGSIIVCLFSVLFDSQASIIDIALTCATFVLIALHDYLSIYYRVVVNYKMVVADNALITVGYALGLGAVMHFSCGWQMVFIVGYAIGTIFVCFTSPYGKEKFAKTSLWRSTGKKYVQLSAATALTESVNYCDRFIIYPSLGGNSVSVYNAAAVMGKAIQLVSVPVQRVLLSYIVRRKRIGKSEIAKVFVGSFVAFLLIYAAIYFASGFVISRIYPAFYEDAKPLIWIVLLGIVLNALAGLFNTLLLRFSKARNQVVQSVIRLVFYVAITLSLLSRARLMAVGIAAAVSAALRLGFVVVLLLRTANHQASDLEY